jgi:hypothetical protein
MRKTKIDRKTALVRSDKNLLAFGLFGAALLIISFLFLDEWLVRPQSFNNPRQTERTIRVETVPARLDEEINYTQPEDSQAEEYSTYESTTDYPPDTAYPEED